MCDLLTDRGLDEINIKGDVTNKLLITGVKIYGCENSNSNKTKHQGV